MQRDTREALLQRLADEVQSVTLAHPTRVAFDGVPAAGKTTLADALAVVLRGRGRDVIRASIESFLFPRAVRYRRGEDSPEGCYQDSFDFDALHRVLLDPLGPGGDRGFQVAAYDKATDRPMPVSLATAPADAVLLFDGVFLLRPELIEGWDLTIFVSTSFEQAIARARLRDESAYGSGDAVERRYRLRYLPSQQFYFDASHPTERADIVVDNDDPRHPIVKARKP